MTTFQLGLEKDLLSLAERLAMGDAPLGFFGSLLFTEALLEVLVDEAGEEGEGEIQDALQLALGSVSKWKDQWRDATPVEIRRFEMDQADMGNERPTLYEAP